MTHPDRSELANVLAACKPPLNEVERALLEALTRGPIVISRADDENDIVAIQLSIFLVDLCVDGLVFREDGEAAISYFLTPTGCAALEVKWH